MWWWLAEAGRPGVAFEFRMPLPAFWSKCCNTERCEEDLRFCWNNSLEDRNLGARSFVWPFLILGAHPGFSSCCLRQKQWDFHWMALGLPKTSQTGSAFHWLGWQSASRAGAVTRPAKSPEARGSFWGSCVVSPAIAHFVLAFN